MSLSYEDSCASIWLGSSCDNLQIVIQGADPSLLLEELKKLIEETRYSFPAIKLDYFYMCPQCIVNATALRHKETNSLLFKELPEALLRTRLSEKELESSTVRCHQGHRVNSDEVKKGFNPISASPLSPKQLQKSKSLNVKLNVQRPFWN